MKALVLASGGIDSTTCLALAVDKYGKNEVTALAVLYGQKHVRELESARKVADNYGVRLLETDLSQVYRYSDCSLLAHSGRDIPEASYADQLAGGDGGPVSTYVPFRNGLFLSVASGIALSLGCSEVWYGAHQDDAAGSAYPDCSPAFFDAMKLAVWEGTGQQVELFAPFIHANKAGIVEKGLQLQVPYQLTWSCYEGGDLPCGKCGTCMDRARAFALNGAADPLTAYLSGRKEKNNEADRPE